MEEKSVNAMAYLREYGGHDCTMEMLSLQNPVHPSSICVDTSITRMGYLGLIGGSLDG
jgi:hypothetical protein